MLRLVVGVFLVFLLQCPCWAQDVWGAGQHLLDMDLQVSKDTQAIASRLQKGKITPAMAAVELDALLKDYTEATNLVRRNTEVVARLVEGTSTHHYNVLSDLFDAQIMRIQKLRDACSFEALYGLKKAQPLYDDQVNIYYARYKQARKRAEAIWPSHAER